MREIKERTVAFTGHREIKQPPPDLFSDKIELSEGDYLDSLRHKLETTLEGLYKEGYRVFINGVAMGFDLFAAQSVVELRRRHGDVELVAAVPYPQQAERFPKSDKELYDQIIRESDRVVDILPSYTPECYHKRNDFMVDNCSVLVAFYNGEKGGTHYTVNRAISEKIRVINLA